MKLLEHQGKELLKASGIRVPPSIVTDNRSYINLSYHKERYKEFFFEHKRVVVKAQVIGGKRKKAGLIAASDSYEESLKIIDSMYKKEYAGEPVKTLLIEKALDVAAEHYLSILWDTRTRGPMVLLGKRGGVEVEEAEPPARTTASILDGLRPFEARGLVKEADFSGEDALQMASFVMHAYGCFIAHDCRLLEINPVIRTADGMLFAGDAKVTIDDSAVARQEALRDATEIEDRSVLSERALEARKIDYHDHRGVAGKTFLELDGDLAVLASGGGASLAVMDALLEAGGRPANYTEYSGDPPREKVRRLTEITLGRPGLKGCLVAGGRANFTDVFETLSGFIEGVLALKERPRYPIVIRRAGPRDKEAFAMLRKAAKEHDLNLHIYGEELPMTKAARILVELAYGTDAEPPSPEVKR